MRITSHCCVVFAMLAYSTSISSQSLHPQSEKLMKEVSATGMIHRPLPLDTTRSLEAFGLRKKVELSTPLADMNDPRWVHRGVGEMIKTTERTVSGVGSLRITAPNVRDNWVNTDHASFGSSQAVLNVNGENWERYNRIVFYIYPDCEGARNIHMDLYIRNDGVLKVPDEYGREGSHEINLVNREWNKCYLEITELPRDKITQISFSATAFGKDRTTGDLMKFDIDGVELQRVSNPEVVSGWDPAENRIVYSTTGYSPSSPKTAIINIAKAKTFQIINCATSKPVFEGKVNRQKSGIGDFDVIDFSPLETEGEYYIKVNNIVSQPFAISSRLWENSAWRALNFIFCERCGFPVPEKHGVCHEDLTIDHKGLTLAYHGGWHDAGDMSQQTLQTGDVMFALFEMANKVKDSSPDLYYRLLEEAEWGLDFVLKCRFGDGYRASSAGIAIWTDGLMGNVDDTPARVHNNPYDNFMFAGMEAYAAMSIDGDKMLREKLIRTSREDFAFALESHKKVGFGNFRIFWEHSYNTSESQYMATASWAATMLYDLTGDKYYAEQAVDFMNYTLACQRTEPLGDKDKIAGFFYRDTDKKIITHFNHQSREQYYIQSLIALHKSQPNHVKAPQWKRSIEMYGDYIKKISKYTSPYGMIPSGIYHIDEAKDSLSFYAQHLFPGDNARQDYITQLKNGIQLDDEHYLKVFPVWFSFRGNSAIHLAMGKAAALCGNFLGDKELLDIAQDQLYWTVGRNPFGQSLMYGEGYNYAQQYAALPGEMIGEMPVGIQTKYNEDKPYWPQANNATYKEVWMTTVGKWLSLLSEF